MWEGEQRVRAREREIIILIRGKLAVVQSSSSPPPPSQSLYGAGPLTGRVTGRAKSMHDTLSPLIVCVCLHTECSMSHCMTEVRVHLLWISHQHPSCLLLILKIFTDVPSCPLSFLRYSTCCFVFAIAPWES